MAAETAGQDNVSKVLMDEEMDENIAEPDDMLDLNHPENFVNRTKDQQRRALIYFLKAGAVMSFYSRIAYAQEKDPSFVVDLREGYFEKAALWGLDLQGADLRESVLEESNLMEANLQGAKLNHASMVYADLRRANLSGADLTGVDMRGALTDGCDMTGAIIKDTKQGEHPLGPHPLLVRQAEIRAKRAAREAALKAAEETES